MLDGLFLLYRFISIDAEMKLSTKGILVARALNHEIDDCWIDWAISMRQQGHDTPHLRIFAGETPPYNQFELKEIADLTFTELDLDWSDDTKLVHQYAVELIKEMMAGEKTSDVVLGILKDIHVEMAYESNLLEFYLLFFAKDDLKHSDIQYYWDGADSTNIENIIFDYSEKWLEENGV